MKLHLGCGHNYKEGWINVDAPRDELCYEDIKADVFSSVEELDYPDNSVDEILMEAVFEHFPRHVAIMQLRKFLKWLKPGGKLTILVPDFWETVKMLKMSKGPKEKQFWFRHLFGPQDTVRYGTHYDGFDAEKLEWMFSIVGFNKFHYEYIKRWPAIRFTGIKDEQMKSDEETKHDIINYMAHYEANDEKGRVFGAWMDAMGIEAKKPETPFFRTQKICKRPGIIASCRTLAAKFLGAFAK